MLGVILDADSLGRDIDLSPITSLLDRWEVYPSTKPNETRDRIKDATVVLSNKIRLDDDVVEGADALKYISVMATGTNNIDLRAMIDRGIAVSNAVGYATPSVVQHTLTLLLNLSTNMPRYLRDVADGRWQQSNVFCLLDHPIQETQGKTLGIVGYGELGQGVAMAASALGLNVLISERAGENPRVGRVAFEEVLSQSDYLSLHCPLTAENENLMNAGTLRKMKSTAYLINTARGGLVNSSDLIHALQRGIIAGAAIDVLNAEPPGSNEPLLNNLPNLLITPHNAWGAIESRTRLVQQMRGNIEGFIAGTPPRLVST